MTIINIAGLSSTEGLKVSNIAGGGNSLRRALFFSGADSVLDTPLFGKEDAPLTRIGAPTMGENGAILNTTNGLDLGFLEGESFTHHHLLRLVKGTASNVSGWNAQLLNGYKHNGEGGAWATVVVSGANISFRGGVTTGGTLRTFSAILTNLVVVDAPIGSVSPWLSITHVCNATTNTQSMFVKRHDSGEVVESVQVGSGYTIAGRPLANNVRIGASYYATNNFGGKPEVLGVAVTEQPWNRALFDKQCAYDAQILSGI